MHAYYFVTILLGKVRSKDIILFPSWNRQADEADHYLLCVEFLLIFLVVIFPNSTGRVSEFDLCGY